MSKEVLTKMGNVNFIGPTTNIDTSILGKLVTTGGTSAVYYVGLDGRRYVFPNEKVYKSWFLDFDDVITLDQDELESIGLSANVTYRPGILLVKIMSDPKVYAVSNGGTLRWVKTEATAKALYGNDWAKFVDDVLDAFFINYKIGSDIESLEDYNPAEELADTTSIDDDRGFNNPNALQAHTKKCEIKDNIRFCDYIDSSIGK